jgi:carbamate kinase
VNTLVVALGGNALLRRGEPLDAETQRANAKVAASVIADLARSHQVVVTHGNGPQVGLLALQNESFHDAAPYPLDVLDAESEGMVGYLLEQELGNQLGADGLATLLTQVVVDASDPAFEQPTKPVGPTYDEATARNLAASRGWHVAPDGDRWRRVVASPEPISIVELGVIRLLVDHGVLVICTGGGGIPVVEDECHRRRGVEAVIDKDLASSLLAHELDATRLLLLTDVDGVYDGWGEPDATRIPRATVAEMRGRALAAGSMGPKVMAACRFVASGAERVATIGALEDAAMLAAGRAGTTINA